MTAISLHPAPRWRVVVQEQLRAVGLSMRPEAAILLAALAIVAALIIIQAFRAMHLPVPVVISTVGGHDHLVAQAVAATRPDFSYGPSATIPMTLAALLLPYGVWGQGDGSVVRYFRSLPLPRFEHTLVRVMSGWVWLTGAVAAYLLWIVATGWIVDRVVGRPPKFDTPAWEWIVPFTSTTIAYVIGSVAVIGSRHPLRWMAGVFFAYLLAFLTADAANATGLREAINVVAVGRYGLQPAVLGVIPHNDPRVWIGATLAWAIPALLALLVVANRPSED